MSGLILSAERQNRNVFRTVLKELTDFVERRPTSAGSWLIPGGWTCYGEWPSAEVGGRWSSDHWPGHRGWQNAASVGFQLTRLVGTNRQDTSRYLILTPHNSRKCGPVLIIFRCRILRWTAEKDRIRSTTSPQICCYTNRLQTTSANS